MVNFTETKSYEPLKFEHEIYRWWEESGFFRAEDKSERPPYCIVIPPPNVTGVLHMGHALTNTIQDILTRWRRMQGYNALWLPGTDHAGIATQAVVERNLKKQGISRHELGREKFLEKVWEWKEQYGSRITNQLRRLGSSLDWERERFTMDEGYARAVREVFVRLYEEGLIYRDNRLINWCPSCRTALSNLEVEHEPHDGHLWHIRYPLVDVDGRETSEYVVVATTRPETMLGDTAVAVNPDPEKVLRSRLSHLEAELEKLSGQEAEDKKAEIERVRERLSEDSLNRLRQLAGYIGRRVLLPLTGRTIPVVGDEHADPAFGTGAVKITPGHDFNDFEVGRRHDLEIISILSEDGTLNEHAGERYAGMPVVEARKVVVEDLRAGGYLLEIQEHHHEVGHCSRCGTVVEPMLSLQWFVSTKPLAEPAIKAVREGDTRIIPKMWEKTYFHWMENIEDWCISRQIWWGHQIPAWYCPEGHVTVSRETPDKCATCGSSHLHQDEDVLDTWFSSALWPFATLGWPEDTDALGTFYPNSVMETGFDILFFWVARMMMMGIHFMGEVPFKTVYLHTLVRDAEGNKMSKSKGNTIDPLDVIEGISLDDLVRKIEEALPPESENRELRKRIVEDLKKRYPNGIESHGTDALRFSLAAMAAQGRDIKLDIHRITGYRAFANKIWQALNGVVLPNMPEKTPWPYDGPLFLEDRWILSRLGATVRKVNQELEAFRFNEAADALYRFFWRELCDWYIEFSKPALYGNLGEDHKRAKQATLYVVTDRALRLLHPFMPFITEYLWQKLPHGEDAPESIMVARYPTPDDFPVEEDVLDSMEHVMGIIVGVRNIRAENSIPPGPYIRIYVRFDDPEAREVVFSSRHLIESHLARVELMEETEARPKLSASNPFRGGEVYVPLEGLVDLREELARLDKALKKASKELASVQKRLSNPSFRAKAPGHVIEENEKRLEEDRHRVETLTRSIEHFRKLLAEQGE